MIEFYKMSGSGNDFILIDNRQGQVEAAIGAMSVVDFVQAVCEPKISVGADGLILIQESAKADFSWRFFNADGSEVEMCGNGGRCAARFAFLKGIAKEKLSFETVAGIIDAEVKGDTVKLRLTDPFDLRTDDTIAIDGRDYAVNSINTGVPHVVFYVEDLDAFDVFYIGRNIRHHDNYQPRGTNANFVKSLDRRNMMVRTYERGVEDETLACGTGSVASVLISAAKGLVDSPVAVQVKSGEKLNIYFEKTSTGFGKIYLEGKAKVVNEGRLWDEAYNK
ncbi:MAG TPA: diaminopimelate epimerase [Syntrophus sp. (in: bacteria)]|nr:diaminopimelate epimerase [Syntrophus sp. (in: bacteria)]